MTKPRLLITRRLPASVERRARACYEVRQHDGDRIYSPDELVSLAADMDAVLCSPGDPFGADTIARLPSSVRVIATFSVGTDHIDLAAAEQRGIVIGNTPDVLSVATAEVTILLMLMAARRAGEGERLVRAERWTGWAPTQLVGIEISGLRLGIVGMGRIGREVARMARGFAMEVHYHNRTRLAPEIEGGAIYHADTDTLLCVSDVLSLNAPATAATRNWLSPERIERLPLGAIVVNAARGSLVDDAALIAALKDGRIAAAGLDVYTHEPGIHPGYAELENVVLLPHLGSATAKARQAMGFLSLDHIDRVLREDNAPMPSA